jgi:cytochrome c-type biogenesis protein CcmE
MQKKYLVPCVLLVASLGFLVTSSLKAGTMKSVPVENLRAADKKVDSFVGQRLRAVGFVGNAPVKSSLLQTPNGAVKTVQFEVVEGKSKLLVSYANTLPDTFRAGGPVQVDGLYVSEGKIEADHVLTKCPSKYQEGEAASKDKDKNYDAPQAGTKSAQVDSDVKNSVRVAVAKS